MTAPGRVLTPVVCGVTSAVSRAISYYASYLCVVFEDLKLMGGGGLM